MKEAILRKYQFQSKKRLWQRDTGLVLVSMLDIFLHRNTHIFLLLTHILSEICSYNISSNDNYLILAHNKKNHIHSYKYEVLPLYDKLAFSKGSGILMGDCTVCVK